MGVAPKQALAHEPQCVGLLKLVSQPGAVVQSPKPGRQLLLVTQLPFWQVTLFGSTNGKRVQSLSQLPQWRGSVARWLGSQVVDVDRSLPPRYCGLRAVQPARIQQPIIR
jgi:hypothetical protein